MPPIDPQQEQVEAFHAMRLDFQRMAKAYEDVVAALAKRPPWADDIMEAVGKVEVSKVFQAKLELIGEELNELKSQCDGRHEPRRAMPPPPSNGNGGA
jgi:hypothetical protein